MSTTTPHFMQKNEENMIQSSQFTKKPSILEVCVDSLDSALIAEKAGALRIELCANIIIGGTTPSYALLEAVKEKISIPFHVLVRPRFGDFCYSASEVAIMVRDIEKICALGADGIVIGCLSQNGDLDIVAMKKLINATRQSTQQDISLTLHRAFDMCKDAEKALDQAESIGINTILTSGQKEACYEGRTLLAKLVQQSKSAVIMAGGGLKPEIIVPLAQKTGIKCFHLSAKKVVQSSMQYKNPDVTMSFRGISEYEQWVTDADVVQKARKELDRI